MPGTMSSVPEKLANKGFNLRQLLRFTIKKVGSEPTMTTNEVVRNIILLETARHSTCYMESDFMRAEGGPQRAHKLVSHAWKSRFANTVLNIVLDAWGCGANELLDIYYGKRDCLGRRRQGRGFEGVLEALEKPDNKGVLTKTYWLCIFAVNEHLNICGDCFGCRLKPGSPPWTPQDFAAPVCRYCNTEKRNPCPCGALKTPKDDPEYEIDKFDEVVKLMNGGIVVSLDPELDSVKRVWVVAEVGEAMTDQPVQFQFAEGLAEEPMEKLRRREPVVPEVSRCEFTAQADYDMILERINAKPGGQDAFNDFVWTMVELQLGFCHRLATLNTEASKAG